MHCSADKSSIGMILWVMSHIPTHGWGQVSFSASPTMRVRSSLVPQGDVEQNNRCFRFFPLSALSLLFWRRRPIFPVVCTARELRCRCLFSASLWKGGAGGGIWAGCPWCGCPGTYYTWCIPWRHGLADQVFDLHWHIVLVCGLLSLSSLSSLAFTGKSSCSS